MEAYARPPADAVGVSASEFEYEKAQFDRSLEWRDMAEELDSADEQFMTAVKTNDAKLIGKLVLAVRDAYLDRLTARALELKPNPVYAEDAALSVLLAASVERAKAQRGVSRPTPYYVSYADATPDERGPGWFWSEETDDREQIHGPYFSRGDALEAIFSWQFKRGEVPG